MSASNTLKAADKQKITKKLVAELKKHYKGAPPKQSLPVLETLLFAALLEDETYENAQAAYDRLHSGFFDLNEIRVSSVQEIEQVLGAVYDPEWKALHIREVLQYVFEKHYAFDFENLKRKTQEAANKELLGIPHLSNFMRNYLIQQVLGAHVIPIDARMARVLKWLGLALEGDTEEQAGDSIKAGLKKSEGQQFCFLLKAVSTAPELQPAFEDGLEEEEVNPFDAAKRLVDLISNPVKKKVTAKKTPKKPATKVSKKKPTTSKTSARTTAAVEKAKKNSKTAVKVKKPATNSKPASKKKTKTSKKS